MSLITLNSCADRTVIKEEMTTHEYGFWGGVWHGMIAPFDFIGSLFEDDITVYAEHNNGHWYAFGFVLGMGGLGGSTRTVYVDRKRKYKYV